ncbi:hypothetical protein BDR05DRAFT_204139 [Suillus weaverae]|nr:hypothetical protein BDR05DRAFT_204139 [Suillus weaverae]
MRELVGLSSSTLQSAICGDCSTTLVILFGCTNKHHLLQIEHAQKKLQISNNHHGAIMVDTVIGHVAPMEKAL